jgi:uncharacterized SAM-binding protein YcdF (DUF218 family)
MIFQKKYMFETRKTKMKRLIWGIVQLALGFMFSWIALALITLYISKSESDRTQEHFYATSPDLVVIYTGDIGRIPFGIKKALQYPHTKIFISGVFEKNNLFLMMKRQDPELLKRIQYHPNLIDIETQSRNTLENVLSTIRYLKSEQQGPKEILIISSDYHILRIKYILYHILPDEHPWQFHYMGPASDFTQWRSYKILFKEITKTFKVLFFFLFWEEDQYEKSL